MNRPLTLLAIAAALAAGATQASAAPTYHIQQLNPTPHGWASQALAISDNGMVVGWVVQERNGPQIAAVWDATGHVKTIGTLPGDPISNALAVNSAGQVVGFSGDGETPNAFIWDAVNGMRSIGHYDSSRPNSTALGISDDGTVVGHSVTSTGAVHAFTWTQAGGMVDPYPNAFASEANGINRKDQWVGGVFKPRSETGVRVGADGKRTTIANLSPDFPYTYGKALNRSGQVVGSSGAADGSNHAFLWDKTHGTQDLGVLPGGTFSNATGINDAGQVVGISDTPQGRGTVNVPFYYDEATGTVDVKTLIADDDPLKDAVQFDAAQAIDSNGVIVVNGTIMLPGYENPRYRAFLLIPQ
jgi:probable HAF family extracellular repeat protein